MATALLVSSPESNGSSVIKLNMHDNTVNIVYVVLMHSNSVVQGNLYLVVNSIAVTRLLIRSILIQTSVEFYAVVIIFTLLFYSHFPFLEGVWCREGETVILGNRTIECPLANAIRLAFSLNEIIPTTDVLPPCM